ncbi:glycyl-tRNA synthetase beta chain [Loktanella fryxellensis]|uniref:Glycine--tRNA ligase beta subunit n=1 Tax=Loktanella fryxellensis TaxID=245187 RepID=A0A1H8GGB1_9RHOB|nr:glycine--tRNA ligase subunit beta [Loktanella fryxellensis]SEN42810.1 glycyl-tRNA synthetase beta chain [Loktanella fryxellensis]
MPDLLIELFSEEIPARMQAQASADLKTLVTDGLVEAGLTYASAAAFATPCRLTLHLEGLTDRSRPVREERKGPKVGAPAQALDGFLRSTGLTVEQLESREDKKGAFYVAVIDKPGREAADIVAEVLERTIRTFPWPKSMRWGNGSLRWVRPLQAILCILTGDDGAEVVPVTVDHITSGNVTRGHRFMAPDAFSLTSFEDYEAKLMRARVMLRPEARADAIWAEATSQAFATGLEVVEDRALLAEVAGLVEWPVVLTGRIDDRFLALPPEVLQTSMRAHQKFFSVRNPKSGRIERFVTVANIEAADGGETILTGNQRVLSARLSDAQFFYDNDLAVAQAGMQPWLDGLSAVTFHNKLGSQRDRIDRIAALAREIAPSVGADPDQAFEAAQIAKADLRSEMVGEFPELQGLMGRYYAAAAGRAPEVAAAAEEHWKPMGPSDAVPVAPVSVAVALADKLDTLTGFWAIDEKPTGSKDPFALRRAALGVIRLVLENDLTLKIKSILEDQYINTIISTVEAGLGSILLGESDGDENWMLGAYNVYDSQYVKMTSDEVKSFVVAGDVTLQPTIGDNGYRPERIRNKEAIANDLLSFFHDRLKVYLKDQGIRHDVIDACIAMPGNDDLTLLVKRARALQATLQTDDGINLLQGFKRANNILTQAEAKDGVEYSYGAELKFAEAPEEKDLFAALDAAEEQIAPAMRSEDFGAAMAAMAALRGPIDAFFTAVQVNADSQILRRNRLNLLSRIRTICLSVADLTRIEG